MERLTQKVEINVSEKVIKMLEAEHVEGVEYEIKEAGHRSCKEICKKHFCTDCPIQKTVDKLAEYENTKLTPEQIIQIDTLYAEKCEELAAVKKELTKGGKD